MISAHEKVGYLHATCTNLTCECWHRLVDLIDLPWKCLQICPLFLPMWSSCPFLRTTACLHRQASLLAPIQLHLQYFSLWYPLIQLFWKPWCLYCCKTAQQRMYLETERTLTKSKCQFRNIIHFKDQSCNRLGDCWERLHSSDSQGWETVSSNYAFQSHLLVRLVADLSYVEHSLARLNVDWNCAMRNSVRLAASWDYTLHNPMGKAGNLLWEQRRAKMEATDRKSLSNSWCQGRASSSGMRRACQWKQDLSQGSPNLPKGNLKMSRS